MSRSVHERERTHSHTQISRLIPGRKRRHSQMQRHGTSPEEFVSHKKRVRGSSPRVNEPVASASVSSQFRDSLDRFFFIICYLLLLYIFTIPNRDIHVFGIYIGIYTGVYTKLSHNTQHT